MDNSVATPWNGRALHLASRGGFHFCHGGRSTNRDLQPNMHFRRHSRGRERRPFRALGAESLEARQLLATIATFDHTPTPYVQTGPNNLQFRSVVSGGATGRYMKFMEGEVAGLSALSFDRTDAFAADTVVAEFMFRDTYTDRAFDQFDFALLNTADYGTLATRSGSDHLAGFADSLSFRFLLDSDFNRPEEIWTRSVMQVVFDGNIVQEINLDNYLDFNSGQWHRARFVVDASAGAVSIDITPEGREPLRVVENLAVPGLVPYQMRAHFSNMGQVNAGNVDLDAIAVNYLRANESYVTFDDWRPFGIENSDPIEVSLRRFGDLSSAAMVRVKTESGNAISGADFQALDQLVTFAPGQEVQTVDLVMKDDFEAETNEYFWLRAISASAQVKTSDPMASIVRIYDDEVGRERGQVMPLMGLGRVPIHTIMLPNGKVMFWGRQHDLGAQIYDPATGEITDLPILCDHIVDGEPICDEEDCEHFNIFCSGHTVLADGRVFIAGGHETDFIGTKTAFIYDPQTNGWTRVPDMNDRRWYPTVIALPNGDALVLHGTIDSPTNFNEQPQVWDHLTNTWRDIDITQDLADNHQAAQSNFYPRAFVLADGRVFYFGQSRQTWFLDTRPGVTDPWTRGPDLKTFARPYDYGTATEYAPGKILITGGRPEGQADAEVIDLNQADPQFRPVSFMNFARRQHNATILPDGRVLITGGQQGPELGGPVQVQLPTEIWDPVTEKFTVQNSLSVERLYHSTGLLMADGSVWTGGTGEPTQVPNAHDQSNMQFFMPPYMFYNNRPEITLAPQAASIDSTIYVTVNRPLEITSASLIRLGSVTHSLEQSASFIPLTFSQAAGGLNIDLPTSANVATPGYYYLTVVDYRGVPSESKIIQVLASGSAALVSIQATTVTEATGVATFQVQLTKSMPTDTTIGYRTLAASASPGSDYVPVESSITIPAGQTLGAISVSVMNDSVREPSQWFSVDLFSATGGVIASKRRAHAIILDDDGETPPTISIADGSGAEGGNISFTVSLSSASTAATFIPYVTSAGTATRQDVSPRAGSITIPAGQLTGTISIPSKQDAIFEEDEYFYVKIVNIPGMVLGDGEAIGTITEDDALPILTPENLTVQEVTGADSIANVIVRLSAAVDATVSVNFTTKNLSALAGQDYKATSGTLVFARGETVKTIPITILQDAIREGLEEFYVNFSGPTRAKLASSQIKVRIRNSS